MTNKKPKEKDLQTLQVIVDFITKNGYSPSFREIGKELELSSSSTIFSRMLRLKELELIDYIEGEPRTISVKGYKFVKTEA